MHHLYSGQRLPAARGCNITSHPINTCDWARLEGHALTLKTLFDMSLQSSDDSQGTAEEREDPPLERNDTREPLPAGESDASESPQAEVRSPLVEAQLCLVEWDQIKGPANVGFITDY